MLLMGVPQQPERTVTLMRVQKPPSKHAFKMPSDSVRKTAASILHAQTGLVKMYLTSI